MLWYRELQNPIPTFDLFKTFETPLFSSFLDQWTPRRQANCSGGIIEIIVGEEG